MSIAVSSTGVIAAPNAASAQRRFTWAHVILTIAVTVLVLILVAPWLAPYSPVDGSIDILQAPNAVHWFGTDQFGRDTFSRFLAGGRSVTLMAICAGLIAVTGGGMIGLSAGYFGGWVDAVLMRCVDVQLSMPPKLLVLVFATSMPRNDVLLVLLVGVLLVPGAARVIRGLAQAIAVQDYIAAAEVAGTRPMGIILREMLPNVLPRLVLEIALRTGFAVLIMVGLNFLGVGISPPAPDWGLSINEGRATLMIAPWICLFPAFGIVVLVAMINLIANALGELLK